MRERWAWPAFGLTFALLLMSLLLMPERNGALNTALLIIPWMVAAVATALIMSLPAIFAMMMQGNPRPIATAWTYISENRSKIAVVGGFVLLAGLNMIAFLLVKPLLNYYVDFWADPLFASVDAAIFGRDPARSLLWLNTSALAQFYHRGWFVLLLAALLLTLWQTPSEKKSALMLTYFILWTLGGPIVHIALPTAGPVFYASLGHGERFEGLFNEPLTQDAARFLWRNYSEQGFAGGSGISAMPSLHIATTTWAMLAVWIFAPRWRLLALITGLLISCLSVSLGWHYAIDGLVGAILAVGAFYAAFLLLRPGSRASREVAPPVTIGLMTGEQLRRVARR